jgi:UDP:flavonoid glycosyltransferase YjiC (YdhE family)
MKIVWFCISAHGHTNPTLGVVKALTEAGHEIYYFSYEMVSQKIREIQPDVIVSDSVAYWGKLAAMKSRYQRVLRKQEE